SVAKGERREWVEGRRNFDPAGLSPGGTTESFLCTDGEDAKAALYLFGVNEDGKRVRNPYRGALLWRLQVRRGPITWKGKKVSATAVIAVEFSDKDYAG